MTCQLIRSFCGTYRTNTVDPKLFVYQNHHGETLVGYYTFFQQNGPAALYDVCIIDPKGMIHMGIRRKRDLERVHPPNSMSIDGVGDAEVLKRFPTLGIERLTQARTAFSLHRSGSLSRPITPD